MQHEEEEKSDVLIMAMTMMIKLNVMIFNSACCNDDDNNDNGDNIDKMLKTMLMTVTLLMFLHSFSRGREKIVIRLVFDTYLCTIAMKKAGNHMEVKMANFCG